MQEELKLMLQEVLQEALKPIKNDIALIKGEINLIKDDIALVKVQLSETNEIVRAIRDRQEETDAKIESMDMEIHKLHGSVATLNEKVDANHCQLSEQIDSLKLDFDLAFHKITSNEREINKIKQRI